MTYVTRTGKGRRRNGSLNYYDRDSKYVQHKHIKRRENVV